MSGVEKLIDDMMKGDPACQYAIGSTVYKTWGEEDDAHPVNTEGTIVGSAIVEDKPVYLVDFENKGLLTFIVGEKISNVSPVTD
jgi:hypothetical protein